MIGNLLDTNVALIVLSDPARLSKSVWGVVDAGPNFLSVVTYWEVVIKSMKGKLQVGDPRTWWPQALSLLVAAPIPLRPEHLDHLSGLPAIHQDPFDRILIAQAMSEGLALVTTDAEIPRYASSSFQVIT